MNKTVAMLQIIRNVAQWDVIKYTILEIYHHRMHGTLVFVPVIPLDFDLHHIEIIFSKVQENNTLSLCRWEFIQSRVPRTVLATMHHAFKVSGIAHCCSHQVLICDVKLWNFYVFVFRFLSFPFQLGTLLAALMGSGGWCWLRW